MEWSGCLFVQAVCVLDPSVQALASPITILNTHPFSRKYSKVEIQNTKYMHMTNPDLCDPDPIFFIFIIEYTFLLINISKVADYPN